MPRPGPEQRRADGTVGALPAVNALCAQDEQLTEQVNLVANVVEGLDLSAPLKALGLLVIPTLPTELPAFTCPTS